MALTYSLESGWGETDDIDSPTFTAPEGFTYCDVLYPRFTLDEPGNMALYKSIETGDFRYLIEMKDIDGANIQIFISGFPSLLRFFRESFAFSFQHAWDVAIGRLEELIESLKDSLDDS